MIEINFCPDKPQDQVSNLDLNIDDQLLERIRELAEGEGVKFETYLAKVLKEAIISSFSDDPSLQQQIRDGFVIPD